MISAAFRWIRPDVYSTSVLELTVERFQGLDRTGILLDVDCTLKDYSASSVPPAVIAWLRTLHAGGLRVCLVSNGRATRIAPLARSLNVAYVAKAFKPLPVGCRAALRLLELPPHRSVMVGDQLFADVLAGRLAGLLTVLVTPTSAVEPFWTRIKRPFERLVLPRLDRGSLRAQLASEPSSTWS